jgi:hypothetical protein
MRTPAKLPGFVVLAGVSIVVMALPTMWLWNWLMPEIFGLKEITVLQAAGLIMLSGILFRSSLSSKD